MAIPTRSNREPDPNIAPVTPQQDRMPLASTVRSGQPSSSSRSSSTTPRDRVSSHASHSRALSPPLSSPNYAQSTLTPTGQQKLNVVTRVAIEGKAKQGQDGASIKMYLKISLPAESIVPGSTVPLFPEENVKILTSQVHPIDINSVPYNFSSTVSPLLHKAARALNLPARSSQTYQSLFGPSHTSASSISSSSRYHASKSNGSTSQTSESVPPLDEKYTGHILVSGYNISFVLPKEFPPRAPVDIEEEYPKTSSVRARRPSIGEKNVVQFMAAIDLWLPFVAKPPRSPYLLSIPTPRCLHNQIKLRIFPPNAASSFASLSSAEDESSASWDLIADPQVTRNASSRSGRSTTYAHFADDESSDSSTSAGFSEGCGIQGTFPSAERIRVRWAKPMKNITAGDEDGTGDGRGRVGVREAKGEMICTVIGKRKDKNKEGLVMKVDYTGTCKGVWFSGVATLLGMDVGLEAKGSDVSWVPGHEPKWEVGGKTGYTGYDVGAPPRSRHSSTETESPRIHVSSSSPVRSSSSALPSRPASSASLLRAPLPAQNIADDSFEGSGSSTTESSSGLSSIGSLPPSSSASNLLLNGATDAIRPPGVPITLHINMNELLPPVRNMFTFSISGRILITPRSVSRSRHPRHSSDEDESETVTDPIILPRFTVLAADKEFTTITICNEVDANANVEVFNSTGDIRDAQTRKTVLQRGGLTKCGEDGGRIALRSFRPGSSSEDGDGRLSLSRPRTPNLNNSLTLHRGLSSSSLVQGGIRRDGPLMIPSVSATVTPLLNESGDTPNGYGVKISLPAPAESDSEWLEFGLAQSGPSESASFHESGEKGVDGSMRPPRVEIISASVGGVSVKFETTAAVKQEQGDAQLLDGLTGFGVPFEEMSGKEWVSWVRVHTRNAGGKKVVVHYVVSDQDGLIVERKGKRKSNIGVDTRLNVFLPSFALPVGALEIDVRANSGLQIISHRSNLQHQHVIPTGRRLIHYSMEELFYPRLSLDVRFDPRMIPHPLYQVSGTISKLYRFLKWFIPIIISLVGLFCLFSLGAEIRHIKSSLHMFSPGSGWEDASETITVTSTLLTPAPNSKWWPGFGDAVTEATPSSSSSEATTTSPVPTVVISPQPPSPPPPIPSASTHTDTKPKSKPKPKTDTTAIPAKPKPTTSKPSSKETSALLPIQDLPFPWPLHFDFDVPVVRITVDKVLEGFGAVWQVFRKVYHYPLDPP